jgi:hypothetical protein
MLFSGGRLLTRTTTKWNQSRFTLKLILWATRTCAQIQSLCVQNDTAKRTRRANCFAYIADQTLGLITPSILQSSLDSRTLCTNVTCGICTQCYRESTSNHNPFPDITTNIFLTWCKKICHEDVASNGGSTPLLIRHISCTWQGFNNIALD